MSDSNPSKYHRFKQDDGRGFGILRLDAIGSNEATIIDANLSEADASTRLDQYRREESAMASDERPSIAELMMRLKRDKFSDEAAIIDAAPVLLEIVKSALEWQTSTQTKSREARARLILALSKVRP